MKSLFFLFLFCFSYSVLFSQQGVKAVKADEEINQVFTIKDLYTYPQFTQGKVLLRDGNVIEAKLNYHRLFEQMLFIGDKNDTLAIASPELIESISINSDTFFYNKDVFLKVVATYKDLKLAERQTLKEIDQQKTGAYGQAYTNNSVASYKNYYTVDGKPRLNVGESTLFNQNIEYFISYKKNPFVPVTRKNIENLFDGKTSGVKEFMKTNSIDLKKEEGIKKTFEFLKTIN